MFIRWCSRKKDTGFLTAMDGSKGLQAMLANDIDLVISDRCMPKKNGLILLKQIRRIQKYKNVPVILLSGLGTRQNVFRGIELGVDAFLSKPCELETLHQTVKKVLLNYKFRQFTDSKVVNGTEDKNESKDISILLVYKNACITDNLVEYLSERFSNVFIEENLNNLQDTVNTRNIDLIITEIIDAEDENFKLLFHRYDQNKFIDIPTIILTERDKDLALFYECSDITVDKIIKKPFEYQYLLKTINKITENDYLIQKMVKSVRILENKLNELKEKEQSITAKYKNNVTLLKDENNSLLNSNSLNRNEKFLIVGENNKKINVNTKKISRLKNKILRERQDVLSVIKEIKIKLHSLERTRLPVQKLKRANTN